jgi:hypothetical protein
MLRRLVLAANVEVGVTVHEAQMASVNSIKVICVDPDSRCLASQNLFDAPAELVD